MLRRRSLWAKLRRRKDRKRIEVRHGKRYPAVFVPRPDAALLEDIESSFTPKE